MARTRELREGGQKRADMQICSDSRATLGALNSHTITPKVVWACREMPQELILIKDVRLLRMPGHSGIKGKEKTGVTAGRGSKRALLDPELVKSKAGWDAGAT